jgi:hypothetical protein
LKVRSQDTKHHSVAEVQFGRILSDTGNRDSEEIIAEGLGLERDAPEFGFLVFIDLSLEGLGKQGRKVLNVIQLGRK